MQNKITDYRVQITEQKGNQINFVDFRRRSLQKLKRAWFLLTCSKILPRRRGSGSDEVDDEGVEKSGKAESRKKKVEIAKISNLYAYPQ